ncbi:MAG: hypothetical protein ACI38A_08205 [Candidatus Ornithomonoglobus sp.]
MDLYTGKVTLSMLIQAIEEQEGDETFYVHKGSGRIICANNRLTHISKKERSVMAELFRNRDHILAEFVEGSKGFKRVPSAKEVDVRGLLMKFAKENPSFYSAFMLEDENMPDEEREAAFEKYMNTSGMGEKLSEWMNSQLASKLRLWCIKNKIDYIDDITKDYDEYFEDAAYVFSVQYCSGCYRHIKISSRASLYDLHCAILDAYHFYDDHAHAFFMNNKAWDPEYEYVAPEIEDSMDTTDTTDDALLAQFNFQKGDKFLYIFDFGAEWRFHVKFLRRLEETIDEPQIIRSIGEAPEQYPLY